MAAPAGPPAARAALLSWYDGNHRVLPWRVSPGNGGGAAKKARAKTQQEKQRMLMAKTFGAKMKEEEPEAKGLPDDLSKDVFAYRVWVSEIMLQQTRVSAAVDFYEKWTRKWPDVNSLAAASIDDVRVMWAGLGYYSRAQRLLQGAQLVASGEFGAKGAFPTDSATWQKSMPGVGAYTSAAVCSIVFDEKSPAVDGNVVRVMSRYHLIDAPPWLAKHADRHGIARDASFDPADDPNAVKGHARLVDDAVRSLAGALVKAGPADRPGDFNQAVMELGATVCIPNGRPRCAECPWSDACAMHRAVRALKPGDVPAGVEIEDVPLLLPRKLDKTKKMADAASGGGSPKRAKRAPTSSADAGEAGNPTTSFASHVVVARVDGAAFVLQTKRPEKGLLAGMWEFPPMALDDARGDADADADAIAAGALPWGDDLPWTDASRAAGEPMFAAASAPPITHVFSHRTHVYHPRVVKLPGATAKEIMAAAAREDATGAEAWRALAAAAAGKEPDAAQRVRWLPLNAVDEGVKACSSGVQKIWKAVRKEALRPNKNAL